MNIGEYLKHEREIRKIELSQIADITKISIRHLKAMEEGRLETLPSRVFVKGFIKAYSKCIGLNPEDVLYRYSESVQNSETLPKKIEPKVFISKSFKEEKKEKKEPFKLPRIKISGRTVFFIIAAVVIILSAIFSIK